MYILPLSNPKENVASGDDGNIIIALQLKSLNLIVSSLQIISVIEAASRANFKSMSKVRKDNHALLPKVKS